MRALYLLLSYFGRPAKLKATREDEEESDDEMERKQKRTKSKENRAPNGEAAKGKKRSTNEKVAETAPVDDTETQPRKKKKKLFPASQETFPWDSLPKVGKVFWMTTELYY